MNNNTYINIIKDTLKKKLDLLGELLSETIVQEQLLMTDEFDLGAFDEAIIKKDDLIVKVNMLDDGFESIYLRIGQLLKDNKLQYQTDIIEIQKLIRIITEKSSLILGKEKSNKVKVVNYLSRKKREVRDFKVGDKTVSNYYKSMTNDQYGESYFLDKKK